EAVTKRVMVGKVANRCPNFRLAFELSVICRYECGSERIPFSPGSGGRPGRSPGGRAPIFLDDLAVGRFNTRPSGIPFWSHPATRPMLADQPASGNKMAR